MIAPLIGLANSSTRSEKDTVNQRIHLKRNGYWEKHRWNGQVKWTGYYEDGKRNGYWKFYSRDGKRYNEGKLTNGKRNGWWYLTTTDNNTRLDGTNWINGHCCGHATMSW